MPDPFQVLGITHGASETEIRKQYLKRVREFPPERNPDEFKEIRAAYEQLRDPIERWNRELFGPAYEMDVVRKAHEEVRSDLRNRRIPLDELLKLGDR